MEVHIQQHYQSNIQGTTFKYGTTNGSYTLSSIPTYTNAGTYTIYWQASKGYVIATGSATVQIEKQIVLISLSASNGLYYSYSQIVT